MGNLEKEVEARQKCAVECALQLRVVWQPWRNGFLSVTEKRPLVSWRWSLWEQGLGAGQALPRDGDLALGLWMEMLGS